MAGGGKARSRLHVQAADHGPLCHPPGKERDGAQQGRSVEKRDHETSHQAQSGTGATLARRNTSDGAETNPVRRPYVPLTSIRQMTILWSYRPDPTRTKSEDRPQQIESRPQPANCFVETRRTNHDLGHLDPKLRL